MARTKATASTSRTPAKKTAGAAKNPTYKYMISEAIKSLKGRNGSCRRDTKNYILCNFNFRKNFDFQFNYALRRGPSGTVKLAAKKEKVAAPAKKAAVKKAVDPKKDAAAKKTAAPKKAPVKKAALPNKDTAAKKTTAPKKAAATAPKKAVTSSKKAPAALIKVKSGRVTKAATAKAAPKKRAAPKKAAGSAASK